jgi:hypothetical protein
MFTPWYAGETLDAGQSYFGLLTLTTYLTLGTQPLHRTIGYYLPPNLLPDSQLSFARARSWLEACDRGHANCRAHAIAAPYMPRRVLEIQSTSTMLRARLTANANLAPYAALSYCWGGDQMAKTVKSRVAAYEKDIPLHTLPRTIHDALIVTRGIGLRYLWVDAMCIVQDDGDDMAEQIGQMYAVYRSAYVTISAATASTSQEVRLTCFSAPMLRDTGRPQTSTHILPLIGLPPAADPVPGLQTRSPTRR